MIVLTLGTALAAYGEIAFQWVGVAMMITSEFSEALRMAVLQFLLVLVRARSASRAQLHGSLRSPRRAN